MSRKSSSLISSAQHKPSAVDKLSDFDDICTDLLVDKVEFWSETHKMAKRYKAKRKVTEREVLDIVRKLVRDKTTLSEASDTLLQYNNLKLSLIARTEGLKHTVSGINAEDRLEFSK